jgi:hypothetical protein
MNSEQAISLQDSGVRRRIQSRMRGIWRWVYEHIIPIRRNTEEKDRTLMAWRAAVVSGGAYIILRLSGGGTMQESDAKLLAERMARLEETVKDLKNDVRYVTKFVDGFSDVAEPGRGKVRNK